MSPLLPPLDPPRQRRPLLLVTKGALDSYWDVNMPANLGFPITPSWTCNDPNDRRFIANKPTNLTEFFNDLGLAALAYSGSYSAVSGAPNFANVATSGNYEDLGNTPNLTPVATAGTYQSLTGIPTALSQFENDLGLAAVALTGAYETLYNAPTAVSQFINDKLFTPQGSNVSQFANDASYVPSGSNVTTLVNNANYTPSGTSVSQFVNDSGYALTNGTTPISKLLNDIGYAYTGMKTNVSQFVNDPPYATVAQLNAALAANPGVVVKAGFTNGPSGEVAAQSYGNVTAVTYKTPFPGSANPVVVASIAAGGFTVNTVDSSPTGCSFQCFNAGNTQSYGGAVTWVATLQSNS